ncbi:chromosome partitioning protein [Auritidibacter sp. NML120779]|nr:chromosome partitioning protein [Auritidibacter sp. NML120779]
MSCSLLSNYQPSLMPRQLQPRSASSRLAQVMNGRNTMTAVRVATTFSARFDHIAAIESMQSEVMVSHRCRSVAELIALARSGMIDVALIAEDYHEVGLETTDAFAESGMEHLRWGVVCDMPAERHRLQALDIQVIRAETTGEELIEWIQNLQPTLPRARDTEPLRPHESRDATDHALRALLQTDPTSGVTHQTDPGQQEHPEDLGYGARCQAGNVIAVWGPHGGVGRSTVAVNLAVELTTWGKHVLLIDADTHGASVATMLGLLDDSAGIAQASRAAEHHRLSVEELRSHCHRVGVGGQYLDVLTGLTRPDRWAELRPSSLQTIFAQARSGWDLVVIDAGFGLEEDEELSFDIPAPQRHAATLSAIHAADTVVAVGTADPIGLPRLIGGIEQIGEKQISGEVIPVLNQVSSASSGFNPKRGITEVWQRFGPQLKLEVFLPDQPQQCRTALLRGQALIEVAPKSPLRRAVNELARRLSPQPPDSRSRQHTHHQAQHRQQQFSPEAGRHHVLFASDSHAPEAGQCRHQENQDDIDQPRTRRQLRRARHRR